MKSKVITYLEAMIISLLYCIGVYRVETEDVDPIIGITRPLFELGSAFQFGTKQEYIWYLKGNALFFPFFVVVTVVVLNCIRRYLIVDAKWKVWLVFFALNMSVWRLLSNSYFYVQSWDLIKNSVFCSFFIFVGWALVFYYILTCVLWIYDGGEYQGNLINKVIKNGVVSYVLIRLKFIRTIWEGKNISVHRYIVVYFVFLALWLPRLLLNYPVCTDWDTGLIFQNAIHGVDGTGYTSQLAIMHLFVKLGTCLRNNAISLFIYMFLQYIMSCAIFAFMFSYFWGRLQTVNTKVLWHCILVGVLFLPQYQSWSVIVSKDTNYSMCILMLLIVLFIFLFDKAYYKKNKLLIASIGIMTTIGVFFLKKSGPILVFVVIVVLSLVVGCDVFNKNKKAFCVYGLVGGLLLGVVSGVLLYNGEFRRSFEQSKIIQTAQYSVNYYSKRVLYFTYAHSLWRNAVEIRQMRFEDLPDEMAKIIDNEYVLEVYQQSDSESHIGGLSDEQIDLLVEYLLKEEPLLVVQAFINTMYFHFDVWNSFNSMGASLTRVTNDNNFIFYCDEVTMPIWNMMQKRSGQYDFLKESYHFIEDIPVVGKLCNMGSYIWSFLFLSFYCIRKKGIKMISIIVIPLVSLVGSVMSGYNAYVRFLLPVVFVVPLLQLIAIDDIKQA